MMEDIVFCEICSSIFDSNEISCKRCIYFEEGKGKYGRTKSNQEYQLEMLRDEITKIKRGM